MTLTTSRFSVEITSEFFRIGESETLKYVKGVVYDLGHCLSRRKHPHKQH